MNSCVIFNKMRTVHISVHFVMLFCVSATFCSTPPTSYGESSGIMSRMHQTMYGSFMAVQDLTLKAESLLAEISGVEGQIADVEKKIAEVENDQSSTTKGSQEYLRLCKKEESLREKEQSLRNKAESAVTFANRTIISQKARANRR